MHTTLTYCTGCTCDFNKADNFLTALMKYHCNADGDLELHLVSLKKVRKAVVTRLNLF